MIRRALIWILSFSVINSTCLAQNASPSSLQTYSIAIGDGREVYTTTNAEIRDFIQKASELYPYRLTADELTKTIKIVQMQLDAAREKNANAVVSWAQVIYLAQLEKIKIRDEIVGQTLQQDKFLVQVQALQEEANTIVKNMMMRNQLEQITIETLSLLKCYVTQPSIRGACLFLINSIESYNFSDEQLQELRRQSTALKKFNDGFFYAAVGFLIGSAAGTPRYGRYLLEKYGPTLARKSTSHSTTSVERMLQRETEVERALRELREADMNKIQVIAHRQKIAQAGSITLLETAAQVSRQNIWRKVSGLGQRDWLKDLAFFLGFSSSIGAANVGLHALNDVYNFIPSQKPLSVNDPDGFKAGEALTRDGRDIGLNLKEDLYDAMAVLHLTCSTHDLWSRSQNINELQKNFPKMIHELNNKYVDWVILKQNAPQYTEKVELPEEIRADRQNGTIQLNYTVKGQTHSETIPCPRVKSLTTDKVEANLVESLALLTETFTKLKEYEIRMYEQQKLAQKSIAPVANSASAPAKSASAPTLPASAPK